MKQPCRICSNSENNVIFVCQEKMFGLGGEFPYFQCGRCRCLQIAVIPQSLERYYPPNYYSFNLAPVEQRGLKAKLYGLRDYRRLARGAGVCGMGPLRLKRGMKILDVGCGRGRLLGILHRAGFRHLSGIDPYVASDVEVTPGVTVRKRTLESLNERFDLIMFHHVLEHIADGAQALHHAARLLSPGGRILVRVPTVDGVAWERYRENWSGLDAPRHFFLHSRSSLGLLAGQAGLAVESTWYDSGGFQFWGSELYKSGQPLFGKDERPVAPESRFTPQQLEAFEQEARRLNREERGDQIGVILAHTDKASNTPQNSA
jgi:SAM-dependent methyltransferase